MVDFVQQGLILSFSLGISHGVSHGAEAESQRLIILCIFPFLPWVFHLDIVHSLQGRLQFLLQVVTPQHWRYVFVSGLASPFFGIDGRPEGHVGVGVVEVAEGGRALEGDIVEGLLVACLP